MNKKMPGIPEVAQSEEKARAYLEATLWPNGPICPHCKATDVYRMTPKATSKKPGRSGLLRCRPCKKQFTVTVGTIFEGSHIPLHKWLMAVHFLTASKKGMSAHQLHRMLGVTYKAAWFMAHRLRYAVTQEPVKSKLRGTVEVDETYIGGKQANKPLDVRRRGITTRKIPVVALVSRSGKAVSFPVKRTGKEQLHGAINENVTKDSKIITDSWWAYYGVGKNFSKGHHTVNHKLFQYVRPGNIHTNSVESYFSLMKRGIMGTFHHIGGQHLAQYCGEFAFRWNTRKISDTARANAALLMTPGKRLVYSTLQIQGAC
ncbi:MAG: IS1595 family transposase [Elusimicrobia bacterium]|nr:IS1595 family transposase [Elusimicrobiota bacterium]MDE2424746.1 IS1595 family transposase [Elusimicrobiota bacterium]